MPFFQTILLIICELQKQNRYKECANLYDEQYHRWVMAENSAESVRIQKEILALTGQIAKDTKSIARSSRTTALFTELNYYRK